MAATARFAINGVEGPATVTAGSTVSLALLSVSGVRSVAWSFLGGSNSASVAPTITPSGVPTGATASFTFNAGPLASGLTWIVKCVINGGVDDNGFSVNEYTATGIVGVANGNSWGQLPFAAGETFERDPQVGMITGINLALSVMNGGGNTSFTSLAQGRGLTVLASWQSDLGVTLVSGKVSQLNDQSGNANHLTQASAPNQPTYNATDATLNNRPSLSFDGSASAMNSNVDLPAPSITIYSVFKQRSWVAGHEYWVGGSVDSYTIVPNVSTPQLRMANTTIGPLSSGATVGSWCRAIQKFTNSIADSLKLGSAAAVTGTNTGNTNPAAGWRIGADRGGTNFAAIDLAMQIIISGTTSAGDDTALDAMVTSLYGAGVLV